MPDRDSCLCRAGSDVEALNLSALDQPLIIRIERIQHIDKLMVLLMCRGVVQYEKRLELLQSCLRFVAAHFLRLVHNDNGIIGSNNVNRSAGAEIVAA